jgi:hypothetical protein
VRIPCCSSSVHAKLLGLLSRHAHIGYERVLARVLSLQANGSEALEAAWEVLDETEMLWSKPRLI